MSTAVHPERLRATLIGFIAILLWATLALFTTATGAVPPFQLLSLTFGIAFAVSLLRWGWLVRRDAEAFRRIFRQRAAVWLLGIAGLFGYHALYFTALDHAPPVEASLICFLWPLLIVLLSAALPGERLHWTHLLGGALGLGAPRCWCCRRPAARSRSKRNTSSATSRRSAAPSPGRSIR
jgi:drug/metabolite transporter (DMT)-like permease